MSARECSSDAIEKASAGGCIAGFTGELLVSVMGLWRNGVK
jgi:hypothetical protein